MQDSVCARLNLLGRQSRGVPGGPSPPCSRAGRRCGRPDRCEVARRRSIRSRHGGPSATCGASRARGAGVLVGRGKCGEERRPLLPRGHEGREPLDEFRQRCPPLALAFRTSKRRDAVRAAAARAARWSSRPRGRWEGAPVGDSGGMAPPALGPGGVVHLDRGQSGRGSGTRRDHAWCAAAGVPGAARPRQLRAVAPASPPRSGDDRSRRGASALITSASRSGETGRGAACCSGGGQSPVICRCAIWTGVSAENGRACPVSIS